MKITRQMVEDKVVTHIGGDVYAVEASELSLPVGQFPSSIQTEMGNGLDFIQTSVTQDVVFYCQDCGQLELHVLND